VVDLRQFTVELIEHPQAQVDYLPPRRRQLEGFRR
jgi:hypothetical protein